MLPGYRPILNLQADHNNQHARLFKFAFPVLNDKATTAPTKDTLPPGFSQWFDDGTNVRLYTNLEDTIYYTTWTAA